MSKPTRRDAVKFLTLSLLGAKCAESWELAPPRIEIDALTRGIPPRPLQAITGSQFAEQVRQIDSAQREQAILSEVLEGNLPPFLRALAPVEFQYRPAGGKAITATVFVMPDYLAIGSDQDFLRIPMNLYTAVAIAARFGFVLPTRKMVDAIYDQSVYHFAPQPLPAGPQMRSTDYYRIHNGLIEKQSLTRGFPSGPLVSGHKKDVVNTNRLTRNPGQIAIYGWHRATGDPIQPLSTVHGARYADYSHGIRLISETAILDGKPHSLNSILQDAVLANVLSDEGPIRMLPEVMMASRLRM